MKVNFTFTVVCMLSMAALMSCASGPKVTRVDASTVTDISEYWNDTDIDIVCKDLIGKFLDSPRVIGFQGQKGRLPIIRVGTFKNASSEPIDTTIISKRMQVQILNSGRADFVADYSLSDELRANALEQEAYSTEATAAEFAAEIGADFLLTGAVKTIIQTVGNQQVRVYDVTADATDITSHQLVWSEENNEIKKVVKKAQRKF